MDVLLEREIIVESWLLLVIVLRRVWRVKNFFLVDEVLSRRWI